MEIAGKCFLILFIWTARNNCIGV